MAPERYFRGAKGDIAAVISRTMLAGPSSSEEVPNRVPDLIFEFVIQDRTDQQRDYIDKRAEYFAIGVREYVIVDRFKQSALFLTLQEGLDDYAETKLSSDDTYRTLLLPGLAVNLSEAFE